MREIKFRFWSPDKRMIYEHAGWVEGIGINEALRESDSYGFKIMQFTGLKDKNGKEIYEGDILKNSIDARLFNWLVDFHDGCFCIRNIGIDGMLLERFKMSQSLFYDREIIGNIYENPILK